MKTKIYTLALVLLGLCTSCDKWINEASTPSNTLSPSQIARPTMLGNISGTTLSDGPLVAHVRTLIGEASAQTFLALGAMGDELSEGSVPNALLYRHLSTDAIKSNSGTADGLWNKLHDLRARSQELLDIASSLASAGNGSPAVLAYARYIGHLGSGLAYQYLAETFSTTPSSAGGSVRISGRLVPHSEMLETAHRHYTEARTAVSDASLAGTSVAPELALRQLTSLSIRLYMHQGEYAKASALLPDALQTGEVLKVIYNANGADNPLFSALGSDARDVQVSRSLEAARSTEAERKALPLAHKILDPKKPSVYNVYISSLMRHSDLIIVSDADTRLTTAELVLRGHYSGNALDEVNALIGSFDTASQMTTAPTLIDLAHLRRVYLAVRGERTADLRRALVAGDATTAWQARLNQWIPLPEREL